jgi:hypothetical protein
MLFKTKQITPLLELEKGTKKWSNLGESHDPLRIP